jgi:hypothetical protein
MDLNKLALWGSTWGKLKILLAFAVMLLMCVSHDILFDKVIPKYFAVFTDSST